MSCQKLARDVHHFTSRKGYKGNNITGEECKSLKMFLDAIKYTFGSAAAFAQFRLVHPRVFQMEGFGKDIDIPISKTDIGEMLYSVQHFNAKQRGRYMKYLITHIPEMLKSGWIRIDDIEDMGRRRAENEFFVTKSVYEHTLELPFETKSTKLLPIYMNFVADNYELAGYSKWKEGVESLMDHIVSVFSKKGKPLTSDKAWEDQGFRVEMLLNLVAVSRITGGRETGESESRYYDEKQRGRRVLSGSADTTFQQKHNAIKMVVKTLRNDWIEVHHTEPDTYVISKAYRQALKELGNPIYIDTWYDNEMRKWIRAPKENLKGYDKRLFNAMMAKARIPFFEMMEKKSKESDYEPPKSIPIIKLAVKGTVPPPELTKKQIKYVDRLIAYLLYNSIPHAINQSDYKNMDIDRTKQIFLMWPYADDEHLDAINDLITEAKLLRPSVEKLRRGFTYNMIARLFNVSKVTATKWVWYESYLINKNIDAIPVDYFQELGKEMLERLKDIISQSPKKK